MSETEQTMEEILESIRQIISEDNDDIIYKEGVAPQPNQPTDTTKDNKDDKPILEDEASEITPQQDAQEDILELVDEVFEEDPLPTLVEESPTDIDDEPAHESDKLMPVMPNIDALEKNYSHRIVSEETETLGTSAFASLERSIRMGNAGDSLEEIVRSILRPMLKSWLDEHLPDLVENLVQKEIERMSIGGRRRADDDS